MILNVFFLILIKMKKEKKNEKDEVSLLILWEENFFYISCNLIIQDFVALISLIIIYNSGLYIKYSENIFMLIYLSIFLLSILTFGFEGKTCFYIFIYILQLVGIILFNFPLAKHNLFHICFYIYLFSLLYDSVLIFYSIKSDEPSFPYLFLITFISIFILFGIFNIFYWDLYYFIGVLLSIFNIYSFLLSYCILDYLNMIYDDSVYNNFVLIRCLQLFPIGSLLFYFGIFFIAMIFVIGRYHINLCSDKDCCEKCKALIFLPIFYIFLIFIYGSIRYYLNYL